LGSERPDEFETIFRLLAPLAEHPAARALRDDVAVLEPPPGKTLVLTHDTMVEGVHFLATDPANTVARKLLRVNLSDLAAKGARPFGYLMSCAWSERCDWDWREDFARGLASDQSRFGLTLLGGDTVSTPGPLTLGATMIGWGDKGRTPSRAGATPGDVVLVSGSIGDGGLRLEAAGKSGKKRFGDLDANWLADRYRRPKARVELSTLIAREATASADVSDGLVADAGNIALASGAMLWLELSQMPMSEPARRWLSRQPDPDEALVRLATAGDDYEILFTVRPDRVKDVISGAETTGCPVTAIGVVEAGDGVTVCLRGEPIEVEQAGWRHR
jgi:thiamine-monophosphate kinase